MNPNEITCEIHNESLTYTSYTDYNCTEGSYRCASCDIAYEAQEEEYDHITANIAPADPTDRAAWYARREANIDYLESQRLDNAMADHVALIHEMQATFSHDHPLKEL